MNTQELALLAAFLSPLAVLAALNVWLVLRGEAGTLLMPWPRAFPHIALEARVLAPFAPIAESPAPRAEVANEERILEAA